MQQYEPGTLINNRYRVVRTIGSGGFGAVYQAVDTGFKDRDVAVKQMLGSVENTSAKYLEERFEIECDMLERLSHPHIPQVFDHFEVDGSLYLVMEFIAGITLEEWTERSQPTPVADALRYSLQVCQVLEYLHGQAVPLIHRDIKPQNIILRPDGNVTLVDFGLVRTLDVETTRTQVGTVGYAAIEQVRGQPEPCSDIYSLGATMYHLLTGQRPKPFQIPDLNHERPDVGERVAAVVAMATQQNPAKRYLTASRMRQAIEAAQADRSGQKRSEDEIFPEISGGAEGRLPSSPVPVMIAAGATLVGLFWLFAHMSSLVDTNLHKPDASASAQADVATPPSDDLKKTLTTLLGDDTAGQWSWTVAANVGLGGELRPNDKHSAELELTTDSALNTLPRTLVFRLHPQGPRADVLVSSAGADCRLVYKPSTGWLAQLSHRGQTAEARLLQACAVGAWSGRYALTVTPDQALLQQESGVMTSGSPAASPSADVATVNNGIVHVDAPGDFDSASPIWFQVDKGSDPVDIKDVRVTHQLDNPL